MTPEAINDKYREREELLDSVLKMLVDYDRYVETRHKNLIITAKKMVSSTPLEIKENTEKLPPKYWLYRTNPFVNNMANTIVGFMLNEQNR